MNYWTHEGDRSSIDTAAPAPRLNERSSWSLHSDLSGEQVIQTGIDEATRPGVIQNDKVVISGSVSPHPLIPLSEEEDRFEGSSRGPYNWRQPKDVPQSASSTSPRRQSDGISGSGTPSVHRPAAQDLSGDISRPSLLRLQNALENQVAAASVASRSSLDEERNGGQGSVGGNGFTDADFSRRSAKFEVEVLMHNVRPKESLAGIALQYGIDLPTLRKVNKLWPSDTYAVRDHLYIPLEACRAAKASEIFIRGPREGEITIVSKKALGKKPESPAAKLIDIEPETGLLGQAPNKDILSQLQDLPPHHPPIVQTKFHQLLPDGRVASLIRIPASELAFFPKGKRKPPSSPRMSLESRGLSELSGTSTSRPRVPSSPLKPLQPFEEIPMVSTSFTATAPANAPSSPQGDVPSRRRPSTSTGIANRAESSKRKSSLWGSWFSLADDGLDVQATGGKLS